MAAQSASAPRRSHQRARMKKIDVYKLTPIEVEDPKPQDDEVLIKVRATVMNTSDLLAMDHARFPPSPVSFMGLECSGTIEKLGTKVNKWKENDEVCAILSGGGYAEKVVVPEGQVFHKPTQVSFTCAACLPHASCVVWSELFMQKPLNAFSWLPDKGKNARLSTGKTLLVHEDYDGISNFAIHIAKEKGVNVYVTHSSESFREHCEEVVVTRCMSQDFFLTGVLTQCVDVILNNLEPELFYKNSEALKLDGTMINTSSCCSDIIDSYNFLPKLPDETQPMRTIIQAASLLHRSRDERAKIVSEVEKNVWSSVDSIKPFVHPDVFPFSKVGDARRVMEAGGCGKIILVPDDIYSAPIKEDGIGTSNGGKRFIQVIDSTVYLF